MGYWGMDTKNSTENVLRLSSYLCGPSLIDVFSSVSCLLLSASLFTQSSRALSATLHDSVDAAHWRMVCSVAERSRWPLACSVALLCNSISMLRSIARVAQAAKAICTWDLHCLGLKVLPSVVAENHPSRHRGDSLARSANL